MVSRKRKLKFAFIDIAICFLLITGLLFWFFRPKGELVSGEYTLLLTVPKEYAAGFSVGASLLDGVGKGVCGSIFEVKSQTAREETATGVYEKVTHERIFLTVRGEAKRQGESLCFGTLSLLPGKRVYLHMPCVCEGICLSVRALEAEV